MNVLVWYPKCSTCQKVKKYLDDSHEKYELRDIKEDRLNQKELKELVKKSGLQTKQFFNTSGLVYKDLNLKDKLPTLSDAEMLKLLASNGMLVKRPIYITKDSVLVGPKNIIK